ncbi:hypothetical protein [Micromonospora sp. NPDC047730]|uniref:hypothetical protein n=1 Tax=Micromonospora sp. NPDC047730 TaxID=3364253 RepID=UPI00371D7FEB
MADSVENCTEWVRKWVLNDPSEILFEAQRHARRSPEDLEEFIVGVLRAPKEGTAAWYTRRELSDVELETRIDWSALADDIL